MLEDKNHIILVKVEYEAENPLHCHLCEKGISPEIYQLYHMDTAHVDRAEYTGERPETCGACGKKFEDKETLMNHFYKTHRQIYFMVYTSDIQLTIKPCVGVLCVSLNVVQLLRYSYKCYMESPNTVALLRLRHMFLVNYAQRSLKNHLPC